MNRQQQHQMFLEKPHLSGAEEWYCPMCGRRITITWTPWKKLIIEPGDTYAIHSGSKGALRVGPIEINQQDEVNEDIMELNTDPLMNDPYLAPWDQWLDEIGFDDL